MAISETKLTSILQQSFPNAKIKINDLASDQDHYSLDITCSSFKDLPLIKQHRLVKDALSEVLEKQLHAITIKTRDE
jgi:stress-induced morphogen